MKTPFKRSFMAASVGALAVAAMACGLPDDIVGSEPTATTNPNVTATPTETPPTPVVETRTPTPTPTATPVNHSALEQELFEAQNRWFENGYANYDYTIHWICFCPPEYGEPARVSVRNGEVVSVVNAETGEPHEMPITEFKTVDGLFQDIREELEGSTEKVEATFDEATGAPLSGTFDRIVQAIDDELAFEVTDLERVNVHVETQADLDAAMAAWDSGEFTGYRFNFRWNCFCIDDYTQEVRIEVRLGAIVSVTRTEDGSALPEADWDRYETIDGLFDLIQDAIDEDAASISAEYDADLGYPTDVFIDYDRRIADEERGFVVTEFVASDATAE